MGTVAAAPPSHPCFIVAKLCGAALTKQSILVPTPKCHDTIPEASLPSSCHDSSAIPVTGTVVIECGAEHCYFFTAAALRCLNQLLLLTAAQNPRLLRKVQDTRPQPWA